MSGDGWYDSLDAWWHLNSNRNIGGPMTYDIMRLGRSGGAARTVYIIPTSADPDDFLVIYPRSLAKTRGDTLALARTRIRYYAGCPPGALAAVRRRLRELLDKKMDDFASAAGLLMAIGAGLAALGIASWVIPDPLPLVDEILFTVGGAAIFGLGLRSRLKSLPVLRDRARLVAAEVADLEGDEEPLLSHIARSLAVRAELSAKPAPAEERAELEAEWLVRSVRIDEMIASGKLTAESVKRVLGAIADILPIRALSKRSFRSAGPRGQKRRRRIVANSVENSGLSEEALDVYCEFFKSAEAYLA